MTHALRNLWNDDSGQGLTEYALLTGAVAAMVVALASLFREELGTMLGSVGTYVNAKVGQIDANT